MQKLYIINRIRESFVQLKVKEHEKDKYIKVTKTIYINTNALRKLSPKLAKNVKA